MLFDFVLPTLCALFNSISFVLLILGFRAIKAGLREKHRKIMLAALGSSALFLVFYLTNWLTTGNTPYPYFDWTRGFYFFVVLIPHVILAAFMTPFIIALVILALKGKFAIHKRLAKVIWPIWVYVSLTGVLVYLLLRIQPLLREPPPQPPVASTIETVAP